MLDILSIAGRDCLHIYRTLLNRYVATSTTNVQTVFFFAPQSNLDFVDIRFLVF
jgi:hypothetical protein